MSKKKNSSKEPEGPKTVQNRKASYDYELVEQYEAGLVLMGSEVKSLFAGMANLTDAFCEVRAGEIFVINLEIQPYTHSTQFTPERRRDRKLLMHKREIAQLHRKAQEKGFSLIPTKIYFTRGKAKLQISLARGRKQFDKRHQIAEKDERRDKQRQNREDY